MHALQVFDEIAKKTQQHEIILLMLDFDGTLAPLASHPDKAFLPSETKYILEKLQTKKNFHLAVISGRNLDNVKEKVGIPNISYGGTHGFEKEIFGKIDFFQLTDVHKDLLAKLKQQLESLCEKYIGAWLEDKKIMLVVHYKNVAGEEKENLEKEFTILMQEYAKQKTFFVTHGKSVYEIKPTDAINKGTFVKELIEKVAEIEHVTPLPIYIGDDTTDEDAFKALPNGITIRVGDLTHSSAKYSLENPQEVAMFLGKLSNF